MRYRATSILVVPTARGAGRQVVPAATTCAVKFSVVNYNYEVATALPI